jgi:transcriptional regulator with XRE-family HTH domain
MAGHRNFRELTKQLEADPQHETRMAELREDTERQIESYQRRLRDIRRACALTQNAVAERLGVHQTQVSRIENQHDLYLSTLRHYVAALGGRLELVATFGDERYEIELEELIEESASAAPKGELAAA